MAKASGVIPILQDAIGKLYIDLAVAMAERDDAQRALAEDSTERVELKAEVARLKSYIESLDNKQ